MPPGALAAYLARPATARYATVVFSLLTALCVFAWARRLYGPRAGLLATTLYAFDPNVLAHGQLTTTDVYAAGTMAMALYFFWRFLREGGWALALASALPLGLTQIAKYTAIVLFPLFMLAALLFHSAGAPAGVAGAPRGRPPARRHGVRSPSRWPSSPSAWSSSTSGSSSTAR